MVLYGLYDRGAQGLCAAIKGSTIYAWTVDGDWCTVTNNGAAYLTGTSSNDYHFRSIQDTTIITNKTVTTAMQAAGTFVANSVATLKLLTLVDTYRIHSYYSKCSSTSNCSKQYNI